MSDKKYDRATIYLTQETHRQLNYLMQRFDEKPTRILTRALKMLFENVNKIDEITNAKK